MKIKATAELEYDCEEVLDDLKKDFPDQEWTIQDAKDTIYNWIKDDFGGLHMEYKIEEINNGS